MHNIYARGNAVFAFMLWVLAAVTFACFLTTVFADYSSKVEVTVNNPRVYRRSPRAGCNCIDDHGHRQDFLLPTFMSKRRSVVDYSSDTQKSDLGLLDFSVKADFSGVFNWNVKQLYLYLVAEYETPSNKMNQVILWDKIVLRSERVVVDERKLQSKYYFLDDGANLLNHPNVTLVLRYNVVPNAGYLRLSQADGQTVVKFPATYTTAKH